MNRATDGTRAAYLRSGDFGTSPFFGRGPDNVGMPEAKKVGKFSAENADPTLMTDGVEKRFWARRGAFWFKKPIVRATLIRTAGLLDSIVAYPPFATDFFNGIDPDLPFRAFTGPVRLSEIFGRHSERHRDLGLTANHLGGRHAAIDPPAIPVRPIGHPDRRDYTYKGLRPAMPVRAAGRTIGKMQPTKACYLLLEIIGHWSRLREVQMTIARVTVITAAVIATYLCCSWGLPCAYCSVFRSGRRTLVSSASIFKSEHREDGRTPEWVHCCDLLKGRLIDLRR
jgi:hypothetical protein